MTSDPSEVAVMRHPEVVRTIDIRGREFSGAREDAPAEPGRGNGVQKWRKRNSLTRAAHAAGGDLP